MSEVTGVKTCRICHQELTRLYTVMYDHSERFYVCDCGAINKVRPKADTLIAPLSAHPNDWFHETGFVDVKEHPPNTNWVGSHVDESLAAEW